MVPVPVSVPRAQVIPGKRRFVAQVVQGRAGDHRSRFRRCVIPFFSVRAGYPDLHRVLSCSRSCCFACCQGQGEEQEATKNVAHYSSASHHAKTPPVPGRGSTSTMQCSHSRPRLRSGTATVTTVGTVELPPERTFDRQIWAGEVELGPWQRECEWIRGVACPRRLLAPLLLAALVQDWQFRTCP